MTKVDQKLLDEIAELEVQAILDGLKDPDLRKSPAFLEKVRKFLTNNKLVTDPTTPKFHEVKREVHNIPDFDKIQ